MKKWIWISFPVALGVAFFAFEGSLFSASSTEKEKLTKITKVRRAMDERLYLLCVGPGMVVGPHETPEVDIFVNDKVLEYRSENPDQFDYPIGSRFEKWKYPTVGAKNPDIATVMVRTGSKGVIADWEFSMHSLPDRKNLKHTGRISCSECHARYKERGFISHESEEVLREFLKIEGNRQKGD